MLKSIREIATTSGTPVEQQAAGAIPTPGVPMPVLDGGIVTPVVGARHEMGAGDVGQYVVVYAYNDRVAAGYRGLLVSADTTSFNVQLSDQQEERFPKSFYYYERISREDGDWRQHYGIFEGTQEDAAAVAAWFRETYRKEADVHSLNNFSPLFETRAWQTENFNQGQMYEWRKSAVAFIAGFHWRRNHPVVDHFESESEVTHDPYSPQEL